MEHNTRPTDTQNAQRVDGTREVGKMQEDYGEWMVVSRRKTNNKTRNKQHSLEMSQSMEPSPTQTSIAEPRVAVQSRKDGKRKALHTQPVVSQRETYKTAMSNHSQPILGKGAKGKGVRPKTN